MNSSDEREHFLNNACDGDAMLRQEVEALLNAAPAGEEIFRDAEARIASEHTGLSDTLTEQPGSTIGRYKLLEKIGEGGMGVVYMAEQEQPVRRKVALKIIKLGMDTRQVVARFEAERQALAMMDHPHIAQVLDAGATETGRPYFVMELVQGVPISEFCEANRLSIKERLELFMPVCQAIQSAHQKGIIHRDIKPSNVLVTMHHSTPHPMVIDFGVAKAIDQKLTEKTLFTNFATMIGTPAYMSPEQAEMSKLDVDTRSDIYSLGVLLYELLTGTTPFPEERLRSVAYGEMQRIIVEEEPERPSTRRKKSAVTKSEVQASKSEIDSDLDWIVMKCLEKDRDRRYETANGLAADLNRHLNNEPVVARPPSAAYRFQKFVRRHRAASVATALISASVLLGIIVSTRTLFRERAARAQSEERLKAAVLFTDEVFTNVAPKISFLVGATETYETLVKAGQRYLERLREGTIDDPKLILSTARALIQLSNVQGSFGRNHLGDYAGALRSLETAAELLRRLPRDFCVSERVGMSIDVNRGIDGAFWGLGLLEKELSHLETSQRWLSGLEGFPEHAERIAREKMRVRYEIAFVLLEMDKPREALALLPPTASDWEARNPDELDKDECRLLSDHHYLLMNACERLGEWENLLKHARLARRVHETLSRREPANFFHLFRIAGDSLYEAHALMRLRRIDEGVIVFKNNWEAMQNLAQRDPANRLYRRGLIMGASYQARDFADWSTEPDTKPDERRRRLAEAEAYLAQAESFFSAIQPPPLQPDIVSDVRRARSEVAAARAKLEADHP